MARNIDGTGIDLTEVKGERINQENQAEGTLNENAITLEAEIRSVAIDSKLNDYSERFFRFWACLETADRKMGSFG